MIEMYHAQELLYAFDCRWARKISDGANFLSKRYNAFGIDVVAEEIDGRDAENTHGAFDDEAVDFLGHHVNAKGIVSLPKRPRTSGRSLLVEVG